MGDPGAGKTWLSSWVIKYLRTLLHHDVPILGIFLNYNDKKFQTRERLIGSLLKQLLQHTGAADFRSAKAKSLLRGVENESRPTLREFVAAFKDEVAQHKR